MTILDLASDLLTEGGELPSMADAAAAAGVAQVTLSRYSATRERLLQALTTATTALDETANRLAKADLDAVADSGPLPMLLSKNWNVCSIAVGHAAEQSHGDHFEGHFEGRVHPRPRTRPPHAVRILDRAWLFVIWHCWQDHAAYGTW